MVLHVNATEEVRCSYPLSIPSVIKFFQAFPLNVAGQTIKVAESLNTNSDLVDWDGCSVEDVVNPNTDDVDILDAVRRRYNVMRIRTEWVSCGFQTLLLFCA